MHSSEQINEIAAALVRVQAEARDVYKNRAGHGYNYADLATVLEEVRPLLSKNHLSFVQLPGGSTIRETIVVKREKGEYTRTIGTVELRTVLLHSVSGQWIEEIMSLPFETEKGTSIAQAAGAAITYARRYALTAMVGIAATSDEDAALPAMINTAELKELRAQLDETGTEVERVCAHFGIDALEDLSREQYNATLKSMEVKRRNAAKEGGGRSSAAMTAKAGDQVASLKERLVAEVKK